MLNEIGYKSLFKEGSLEKISTEQSKRPEVFPTVEPKIVYAAIDKGSGNPVMYSCDDLADMREAYDSTKAGGGVSIEFYAG